MNTGENMTEKIILITGGNSGIGFEAAKVLSEVEGNKVYILCRSEEKGKIAQMELGNKVELMLLDLADLGAVKRFTENFPLDRVDTLINNAGVMDIPKLTLTKNGLETQVGVNHFGHFALTTGLLDKLKKSDDPRVITVSSIAAYAKKFDYNNINAQRHYSRYGAYQTSKLCNLLFMHELGRRNKWLTSVAVHPGVADTNIARNMGIIGRKAFDNVFRTVAGQTAEEGAIPMVYAAITQDLRSGMFIGPKYMTKGPIEEVKKPLESRKISSGQRLWALSETIIESVNTEEE